MRTEDCPQCGRPVIQTNLGCGRTDDYCEECGWPDENRALEKRILLMRQNAGPTLWKASSRRYSVSAYGRTVQEAKRRLFSTTHTERVNRMSAHFAQIYREYPNGDPMGPPSCGFNVCRACYQSI